MNMLHNATWFQSNVKVDGVLRIFKLEVHGLKGAIWTCIAILQERIYNLLDIHHHEKKTK